MRRADRLMSLIQILRDGTLHKAEDLAAQMGVSLRTVYRDMDTLAASGVPIVGERGVGYRVTAAITLPPLNLTMTELEALHIGLMAVEGGQDTELAQAARTLNAKLDAVMPEDSSRPTKPAQLAIHPFSDAARGFAYLPQIRQALRTKQKMMITLGGVDRTVRPLKLEYWGRLWTCTLWCETTRGFDEVRLDQITALRLLPSLFVDEPDKSLAAHRALP